MSKVSTSDFRTGMNILIDGEIYSIVDFQHVKPGKGGAFVRTKLKGVVNEKNIEKTFRSGESVESIRVERQPYQFLYSDGDLYFFMHQETYEQIPLERSRVEKSEFVSDGMICTLVVDVDNENILYAEPPDHIDTEVVQTDPGLKGDTAQGGSKPATISGGAVVQVPLFINEGDLIRVDTRTSEYVERVKSD
ncbi:elongation factor P [Rhodohalobacter sulfatireducens]|uniref:Elongation factor P n=1 Tax=Rhodohalobacter sulfatireducens TaxID=2911366 RepID=A0ABS9KGV7_9BACT|nr:elongation factor P [Rhodohalobacter sulfatireducens]MCG2590082.1 elongation factor P [Rhodohalobacter sulfatireducens]MDR9410219.1 elongation factor P [Balneolaceae bacterium]